MPEDSRIPDGTPAGDETRAAPATAPTQSETIGPYRLLERVGAGGMGEVWLAEQTRPIRRQVALKIIKAGMDTAQVVTRFEVERQALALMDHPAIARVFDAGATPQGRPYFALEYVRGEPITAYCNRHRLNVPSRLNLFVQVCEGVQHAHQKGVIHRDLKPSNVLVALHGDCPVAKIIDFGVAKATTLSLTERTLHTEFGAMLGTPEYMSPEQAEMGGLEVDTRTDVYALGVILYELLTGVLPFDSKSLREGGLHEIRQTIREVDPPRPSTRVTALETSAVSQRPESSRLASQLRGDLDWITMKALDKDRARRYETANGLAMDVRRHLSGEPVLAAPPSASYRIKKFVRRNRPAVAAGAALAILLVAFGATMAVQARRIARERDRANLEALTATRVSDFLVGLFNVSAPTEARGNAVTAREILDKGAQRIQTELTDQPELQARLMSTMGSVYTGLGLYAAAEPLLRQSLAIERRVLGDQHADTLATMNALANAHWYQAEYREAEPLYLAVVEGRRESLGESHPETLRANFDLASLYAKQSRFSDAEQLGRKTLESQRIALGDEHPDTIRSMGNLSAVYHYIGRHGDEEKLAMEVLTLKRRVLGENHPSTLTAMHNLATAYWDSGRVAEAEALFVEAIRAKSRVLGESHSVTAQSQDSLAALYARQRRYREAERLALSAYESFSTSVGPDDSSTQRVVATLVEVYRGLGRPSEAEAWGAKLTRRGTGEP